MMALKGLAEAAKGLNLGWKDALIEKGRLAFRMGIEIRNNPETDERFAKLFKQGWELESEKFFQSQRRERGPRE
jgi:hypothetical protein